MTRNLIPKDHTLIIETILENYTEILLCLDYKLLIKQNRKPTGKEILCALVKVEKIDSNTKDIAKQVLKIFSQIEKVKPYPISKKLIDTIIKEFHKQKTNPELVQYIINLVFSRKYGNQKKYSELSTILTTAIFILIYGLPTIYSVSFWSPRVSSAKLKQIGKKDLVGALEGGLAGLLFAQPIAGAIGGSIVSSGKEAFWEKIKSSSGQAWDKVKDAGGITKEKFIGWVGKGKKKKKKSTKSTKTKKKKRKTTK